MAFSSRIRRHLQSHVVGYLALFVALSGTALALPGQKTVKGKDIANAAVKKRAIAGGAVVSGKLAGGAVTSAKLSAGAVGASQLADNAVERKKLKAQAVTGSKIADGAVTTPKVADASLLGDDFAPGQISDAFVFPTDFGQTFSIKRAGRVYVVATVLTDCATAPCHFAVDIDNFPVEHAAISLDQPAVEQQVTIVGISRPLEAGNHLIRLVQGGGPLTISNVRLSGVLIQ